MRLRTDLVTTELDDGALVRRIEDYNRTWDGPGSLVLNEIERVASSQAGALRALPGSAGTARFVAGALAWQAEHVFGEQGGAALRAEDVLVPLVELVDDFDHVLAPLRGVRRLALARGRLLTARQVLSLSVERRTKNSADEVPPHRYRELWLILARFVHNVAVELQEIADWALQHTRGYAELLAEIGKLRWLMYGPFGTRARGPFTAV
ncbi:hypothetical protein [Lentzea sp. E54]|uniref:hypothetical protein n=1 Tax=Lentzea xerophila TaxID=3435883 RepID=UPI003DA20373